MHLLNKLFLDSLHLLVMSLESFLLARINVVPVKKGGPVKGASQVCYSTTLLCRSVGGGSSVSTNEVSIEALGLGLTWTLRDRSIL